MEQAGLGSEPAQQARQPAYRPSYLWVALVFGVLLVVLSYGLGFNWNALALFFVTSCLTLTALPPKSRLAGCAGLAGFGFILAVSLPTSLSIHDAAKNADVKQKLHSIQLALERYATDYNSYPASIAILLDSPNRYMDELPKNPFRAFEPDTANLPAITIPHAMHPLGEVALPETPASMLGDFVYIPSIELHDGVPLATAYTLIAFGNQTQNWLRTRLFPVKSPLPILQLSGCLQQPGECPPSPPMR